MHDLFPIVLTVYLLAMSSLWRHWYPCKSLMCILLLSVEYPQPNTLCPKLKFVNGTVNSTELDVGASVMFSCNSHYEMIGNVIINCVKIGQQVRWNGHPPICYSRGMFLLIFISYYWSDHNYSLVVSVETITTPWWPNSDQYAEEKVIIIISIFCVISATTISVLVIWVLIV